MDALPKIRDDIDATPFEEDGERFFALYDRAGLSEAQLAVSPGVMFIASRLDGEHSALKIRELFEREVGEDLPEEDFAQIIEDLDASYFLDNQKFAEYYQKIYGDFLNSDTVESSSSGSAYSDDPVVLKRTLDMIIKNAPKPEEEGRATNAPRPAPRGVIAPHMDYGRAAQCYGQVYHELAKFNPPEAVVVIGTAHQPINRRFAICKKNFSVPGGVVECHKDLTQELLDRCKEVADFTEDIFAHRHEHSIELQAVWLKHIWPGVKIIPILAGSLAEFFADPSAAAKDEEINILVASLKEMMISNRLLIMASADLAHIGERFEDERELDDEFLLETERADRAYLEEVKMGHPLGGLAALAVHNDRYRVCGTGCIFALNSILPQVRGRLLGYHVAHTEELKQAVSCAGVLYE